MHLVRHERAAQVGWPAAALELAEDEGSVDEQLRARRGHMAHEHLAHLRSEGDGGRLRRYGGRLEGIWPTSISRTSVALAMLRSPATERVGQ